MIVRILGEGQLRVDDSAQDELSALDARLEQAVERNDESAFEPALHSLLARVRALGEPVDAEIIEPSELIFPQEGATMAEVRQLLSGEGVIPG